jgi:hypothetical protein
MLKRGRSVWCAACLGVFLAGCGLPWHREEKPDPQPKPSKPLLCQTPEERAGYPQEISCLARPSDTGNYVGYNVGGGCAWPHHGEAPGPHEGTWGWDYPGCCGWTRVALDWWHGKYQGGYGAYATDGPRPLEELERKREENSACCKGQPAVTSAAASPPQ